MSGKQTLWVEGKDDLRVILQLFKRNNVPETFAVEEKKGVDNIFRNLDYLFGASIPDTLGIILDADQTFEKRWQKIKGKFDKAGYEPPDILPQSGLILNGNEDLPRIGLWIMPNNLNDGMLEDFILQLIRSNDVLLPEVETILNTLEKQGLNRYKNIHKTKAKVHTWLAWQEKPGRPMGAAINEVYFDTDMALSNLFISWINDLFNLISVNQNKSGA